VVVYQVCSNRAYEFCTENVLSLSFTAVSRKVVQNIVFDNAERCNGDSWSLIEVLGVSAT